MQKTVWSAIDDLLKPLIKKTLGIPPNSANEYLYGAREDGLFGLPIAAEDSDIAHIDGGYKLLTSKDPVVQILAWEELTETANYRHQSTRFGNMQDFLNTAPSPKNSNK